MPTEYLNKEPKELQVNRIQEPKGKKGSKQNNMLLSISGVRRRPTQQSEGTCLQEMEGRVYGPDSSTRPN